LLGDGGGLVFEPWDGGSCCENPTDDCGVGLFASALVVRGFEGGAWVGRGFVGGAWVDCGVEGGA